MLNKKLLILGTMSALLATTVFGSGTQNCVGGVCFINLDNLNPSKSSKNKEHNTLASLGNPSFTEATIDKTITIIVDGVEMTVFPSYVMTEEEKMNYFENKEANKDLLRLTQSVEKIEDKILEKSDLPLSEYFCEKETKPLYNKELDSFQCV
ncbi:MAG: Unknown protein [uncultured Sulfurovum sp.]|uniref:Uncharacterized protein n=1 Tax=uncultured Sulfurovum sp. TaxID=269237 RepID=A0A6S6TD75_9BACT|nr:MAG: Unknown protein [uncultured Sulfurovum sp.]